MIAVLQRVLRAKVTIRDGPEAPRVSGEIGRGLMILLGVGEKDGADDVELLARKIAELRIFEDPEGKMNLSVQEVLGEALVVSQFTLLADARKGRRPSFIAAARPEKAIPLYELFVRSLAGRGVPVETGVFGASMEVDLANDGPVTIILDSDELRGPRRGEGE